MNAPFAVDPVDSARAAGLRYAVDNRPGITRHPSANGFEYFDTNGKRIADEAVLSRIKSLGLPPAWTDVWICPQSNGHLQATGRDARGRKQYRYHAEWRSVRDETKFARMVAFGKALKQIRARVDRDLRKKGLPREKVLATVVRLLETTLIRVGNDEYAKQNNSFGLTTMRDRHAKISGAKVGFEFRGKSGKWHTIYVEDKRLARIVKNCRDIPGHELFQYYDADGKRQSIDSSDVNAYLREITGQEFTAKDFRTWAGTVCALMAFTSMSPCESQAHAKQNVSTAIKAVAEQLGNTPTVCRKYYVHPAVIDAYQDGHFSDIKLPSPESEMRYHECIEKEVLKLLKKAVAA